MLVRLLGCSVAMLAFGYAGAVGAINAWIGFAIGMAEWAFILFEIFAGEAGNVTSDCSDAVRTSSNNMYITALW